MAAKLGLEGSEDGGDRINELCPTWTIGSRYCEAQHVPALEAGSLLCRQALLSQTLSFMMGLASGL